MNSNRHNYYTRQTNDLEVNTENVENAYKFFNFHGVGNSSVTELNFEQFEALLLVVLHKRLVLSGNYVMPRVLLTETILEKRALYLIEVLKTYDQMNAGNGITTENSKMFKTKLKLHFSETCYR